MIPAIVLAAGRSTRMGRMKPNLPIAGGTFLSVIVRAFLDAGVDDVTVVLGHELEAVREEFAKTALPARLVANAAFDSGQLSSLLAGLDAIDRPDVEAALVTLVDVPLVSPATIRAVIDCYRRTAAPVVRPTRGSEHGHPLLIARALFASVRCANPTEGVKPVVRAHATSAGDLPIDDPGAFLDIDTPEDSSMALTLTGKQGGSGR